MIRLKDEPGSLQLSSSPTGVEISEDSIKVNDRLVVTEPEMLAERCTHGATVEAPLCVLSVVGGPVTQIDSIACEITWNGTDSWTLGIQGPASCCMQCFSF